MKKFLVFTAVCFVLSACIPAALQPQPAASPAPISDTDIQATVAVEVAQTIESLPTPTIAPSSTAVVITATNAPTLTPVPPTSTNTVNPTLSVTVAPATGTTAATSSAVPSVSVTSTGTAASIATTTGTAHYQYYGTMPPNLPFGKLILLNLSRKDAYISLQCTTSEGYTTVIEYPLGGSRVETKAPAGSYFYVAWVGGKQYTGSFKLAKLQDLRITIRKDRIEIK